MEQAHINALAFAHGLVPKSVQTSSDGRPFAILARDSFADLYFQVLIQPAGDGKVSCHVGLYGDRCILNDGERIADSLESAIAGAVSRIALLEAGC